MKKTSLLIGCFLVIFLLCACSAKKDELQEPVHFYYTNTEISFNSDDGVLAKEIREGAGFHSNLSAFLHAYLRGPVSPDMESIIPTSANIIKSDEPP